MLLVRVRVLFTGTSAVQVRVRYEYGCHAQIFEQNVSATAVLHALALIIHDATTATTLLLYDRATS